MKKKSIILLLLATITILAQNEKQELLQTVQKQGIAQDLANAPDGVTIRLTPTGGFQIFAVGTGAYDFDDVNDVMDAQKEATLKAKANLAKFMNESINSDEKIESMSKKVKSISIKNGETSSSVNKVSAKKALTSIRNSSAALLKGVIVLASSKVPSKGSSGTYRVMVGVSSKTLTVVNKFVNGTAQANTPVANASTASNQNTTPAANASTTTKPNIPLVVKASGTTLPEGWIECTGQGLGRKEAISAALTEGIQQVYGVSLQNDAKIKERMAKLKFNTKALRLSNKSSESNTLTQTAGFVKEYRIISVKKIGGGKLEAIIHALIVNPRSSGVVAIMLHKPTMPLENLTKSYNIGPERRLSGSDITTVVGKTFNRAFANANKFLVLDMEDLAKVVSQQQISKAIVNLGLAPSSELLKAGQLLTADYILTSAIEDLKYSKKIGYNKRIKKFGPIYQMSIRMNYKLTDVTTGHSLLSNVITAKLNNDEISALLADDEDSDLLLALMEKVTNILNEAILQK